MPSGCFMNLPEEKKYRIIAAALEEAGNEAYERISINKIIKNAKYQEAAFTNISKIRMICIISFLMK